MSSSSSRLFHHIHSVTFQKMWEHWGVMQNQFDFRIGATNYNLIHMYGVRSARFLACEWVRNSFIMYSKCVAPVQDLSLVTSCMVVMGTREAQHWRLVNGSPGYQDGHCPEAVRVGCSRCRYAVSLGPRVSGWTAAWRAMQEGDLARVSILGTNTFKEGFLS